MIWYFFKPVFRPNLIHHSSEKFRFNFQLLMFSTHIIFSPILIFVLYDIVDPNMSDSNVGARKNKCFDSLWAQETRNGLYDLGVCDNKIALISALNDKCRVTIKTSAGQTEEFLL